MKKLSMTLLIIMLCLSVNFAEEYAIFGGIKGDITMKSGVYYYQEVTFITGEPVILTGTITIPEVPKDKDTYSQSISYDVDNKQAGVKISRKVTYDTVKSKDNAMGQTIINTTIPIGKITETITAGSDTYKLTSFKFSDTEIKDVHPGIAFDSGNILYKKVYAKNGDEFTGDGLLTIEGESKTYLGYDSYWSKLSTRVIDVSYDYVSADGDASAGFEGNATLKFSTNLSSNFNYVRNDVENISFRGGLLKSDNTNVVLQYTYSFYNPKDQKKGQPIRLNEGEGNLNTYSFETATRLPVPKYKDTGGHWAEEQIFRLGSLEAFDSDEFFFPDTYVTREQFAMALINSIDHVVAETAEQRRSEAIKLLRPNAEPLPFTDVDRESLYYIYIERAQKEGLMIGEEGYVGGKKRYQFLPTRPLTRQEAITVIVRALGIEDIAPILPFNTGYTDDYQINNWAKPSIYMAREVGIVEGYPDNTSRPLNLVTRAEAAAMLSRFIDHLREDITTDYREKLLNSY